MLQSNKIKIFSACKLNFALFPYQYHINKWCYMLESWGEIPSKMLCFLRKSQRTPERCSMAALVNIEKFLAKCTVCALKSTHTHIRKLVSLREQTQMAEIHCFDFISNLVILSHHTFELQQSQSYPVYTLISYCQLQKLKL